MFVLTFSPFLSSPPFIFADFLISRSVIFPPSGERGRLKKKANPPPPPVYHPSLRPFLSGGVISYFLSEKETPFISYCTLNTLFVFA